MTKRWIVLIAAGLLFFSCGVKNPLTGNKANYRFCDLANNLCIQYPRAILPPPEEGQDADDLILSLYSEEYDIKLLLSADKNAEQLTFEQIYKKQLELWKGTYDDVDEEASQIGDHAYELSARADDYYLYAKTIDLNKNGTFVTLRLVGGPELTPVFFADLKEKILLFPNK